MEKIHDLRKKSEKELHQTIQDSTKKLVELRFHAVQGKIKNVSEIQALRRTIARVKTILQENKKKLST
jgi:large subunit ribosomal protein L29